MIVKTKKSSQLVYIVYDSITNSVFESQVLQPLLIKAQHESNLKILLISFEKKIPSKKTIQKITAHDCIELKILKRPFFLGLISLRKSIKIVHAILKELSSYELIARGPHAGWLSLQASQNTPCNHITIQARGILPEEYAFVHSNAKFPLSWIHAIRKKLFFTLEKSTYFHQKTLVPTIIEAVSPALKDYLISHYQALPDSISIATDDIPKAIDMHQLNQWRSITRKKLGIPKNSHVYCYNGSAKPWQCPEIIIKYFVEQQKAHPNSFLLILTQDKTTFHKLLKTEKLDPSHYYICTTDNQKIFQYLAACDTGLLFREKSIINWVSRPTKMLEYQAANLKIAHNNTIALLSKQPF